MLDKLDLELSYKNDQIVLALVTEWDLAQGDLKTTEALLSDKEQEFKTLAERICDDMQEIIVRLGRIENGGKYKETPQDIIDYLENRIKHYEGNL